MKVRVGIVGLGFMGSAHARVYSKLKNCELVGLCDNNPERRYLAETYHCKFFEEIRGLLEEKLDAVSICTPTTMHKDVAMEVLEKDKHVFIEKPLAPNVRIGKGIVGKAVKTGKLLAVGHIERFNSAVKKLIEVMDFSDIYSTASFRFGPFPPRIKDVGVLLDLGSHEIDLLNYLTKTKPEVVYVHTSTNLNNNFEDYAFLSLRYNHIHSHIETSWLPNYKLRIINLYGNKAFYTLNYAQQNLKSYRAPPKIKIEHGSWRDILWFSRNVEEHVPVSPNEPLNLELKCFIRSVQKDALLDPLCRGEEALEVLKVTEKALEHVKKN